jgi:DNA primase
VAYPESFLQELAEKNDIVDVVSDYVKLSKRSGQSLFGLCPFHSEKTPSFSVSPGKQIYHCFGCGKGGSVINFIMEIENLSFPEAVEFLAKRCGMKMPEQDRDPGRPRREKLFALNRDAAMFFHEQFFLPERKTAQTYAAERGIGPKAVKSFGLGYAPDSWDALARAMKDKGYSEKELIEAALVRQGKKGGVYDTFRDRLMFPVIDVRGNVVGFSGRAVGGGEPKYMNSPETPVLARATTCLL